MRDLVIGDIHNKFELLELILKGNERKYDHIIILGDFFDDFDDNARIAKNVAIWLKESLKKKNRIHIFGNHDLHYRFPRNNTIRGSGFSGNKSEKISKILKYDDWDKMHFYYQSQGFIFSHAGFNKNLLHPINGFDFKYIDHTIFEDYQNALNEGCESIIFGVGKSRGGWMEKGGITWQDWDIDFEPISEVNQIVGHTHSNNIRYKNYNNSINVCVDCFSNYILEIMNGKLNEINLKGSI